MPKYIPKNAATLMTPGLLTPEPAFNSDSSKDCKDVADDKVKQLIYIFCLHM